MIPDEIVVSVINYRTPDITIQSISSLLKDLGKRRARIILVDNASCDGSVEILRNWINDIADDRVELVESARNVGFAGGHNQSISRAPTADCYIILNSDTLVFPGFFDELCKNTDSDSSIGIVAPRLEWEDGTPQENCFRMHGPISELIRSANSGPISKLLQDHDLVLPVDSQPKEVAWVSFACVLLRGDMVRNIGPLDEGYFMYYEDAEYCLRAARNGWSIRLSERAKVTHFEGGSGPVQASLASKGRLPIYYWHSRARYLRQAHSNLGFLLCNLGWYLGRGIALLRPFAGKRIPASHGKEWLDIWRGAFLPLETKGQSRD